MSFSYFNGFLKAMGACMYMELKVNLQENTEKGLQSILKPLKVELRGFYPNTKENVRLAQHPLAW